MKISKSKQELAHIISENGGWRDAEFAAQDSNGSVTMFSDKPYRQGIMWESRKAELEGFIANQKIANWHQTILSRAEYFHLYPAPDADGWIEFDGTERPSGYFNKMIDVKLQDGRELTDSSGRFEWDTDGPSRIIAYRLHKQSKPEFCESVGRSIPESEYKPSIEQLATDYRNAKDYADRKQIDADAAKADADAKLKALELAGEELFLKVSPITAKQEHGLVITELRDLRVGDEVKASYRDIEHVTGTVIKLDIGDKNQPVYVSDGIKSLWATDWEFIRRP